MIVSQIIIQGLHICNWKWYFKILNVFCQCRLIFDFQKKQAFKFKYFFSISLKHQRKIVHLLESKNIWYVYWTAATVKLVQEAY